MGSALGVFPPTQKNGDAVSLPGKHSFHAFRDQFFNVIDVQTPSCIALHCIVFILHCIEQVFFKYSFFNSVIPITLNILSPNCVFFPTRCIDLNHVAPFSPQSPQPLVTAKPSSLQSLPSGKFSWEKAVAQTRCVTVGLYLHIAARSHSYPLCTAHNA